MRRRRVRGRGAGPVFRRAAALFLAGAAVWLLWLTVDFRPAGQALERLGRDGAVAAALLDDLAWLALESAVFRLELPRRPILLFQEDRLFPRRSALEQVRAVLPRGSWAGRQRMGLWPG